MLIHTKISLIIQVQFELREIYLFYIFTIQHTISADFYCIITIEIMHALESLFACTDSHKRASKLLDIVLSSLFPQ